MLESVPPSEPRPGDGVDVEVDDEALESVPPPRVAPVADLGASSGEAMFDPGDLGAAVEAAVDRISEPPPEVAPEDFEVTDPVADSLGRPAAPPPRAAPAASSSTALGQQGGQHATGSGSSHPELETGFAAANPAAATADGSPPPSNGAPSASGPDALAAVEPGSLARKRYWWEELFGDDFLRTMKPMTDAQLKAEVSFIEERLALEKGALVLDLACGTGRHAVELAVRGYNVVGYDLSLAMLSRAADEAQERGQKINFLHGDMRELDFDEAFDAVMCWTTSFGYFDEEKNFAVAQRIQRALRPGGLLLLDVVNRDFVAQMQPTLAWFEGDGCVCMDDARLDFFSSRLKIKRTVMLDDGRSREIDYSMRVYSLHELGRMLHDAGFKVIEVTGRTSTPGVFLGVESPRLIVLAEKP